MIITSKLEVFICNTIRRFSQIVNGMEFSVKNVKHSSYSESRLMFRFVLFTYHMVHDLRWSLGPHFHKIVFSCDIQKDPGYHLMYKPGRACRLYMSGRYIPLYCLQLCSLCCRELCNRQSYMGLEVSLKRVEKQDYEQQR